MRSTVALVHCPDYDPSRVRRALRRGIDLLGGMAPFTASGERILVKPNLLVAEAPERGVTTHPSLFAATLELFREAGARVLWGDSPGFGSLRAVAGKAGLIAEAEKAEADMADFETAVKVSFPDALLTKQLTLARGAVEAEGIVSLARMKTHPLTRITGAIKNTFGCVPGLRKGEFHVKMPQIEHFSAMLVDINRCLKPRLYILDGIMAMEGNGPRAGTLRAMGVLLLSSDPVAIDAMFCRLIDMNPEFVPTSKPARESGLGTYWPEEIDLVGDPPGNFTAPDFQVVREPAVSAGKGFPIFLKNRVTPRPVIDARRCTKCGSCVQICPVDPKAMDWQNGRKDAAPVPDYRRCIRCYCCQEICPFRAISIVTPLLGRIIHR